MVQRDEKRKRPRTWSWVRLQLCPWQDNGRRELPEHECSGPKRGGRTLLLKLVQ